MLNRGFDTLQGYAFLVFLFAVGLFWRTRWRVPVFCGAALYALLQSFAAVYTGNHYVVDLLIGYLYAAARGVHKLDLTCKTADSPPVLTSPRTADHADDFARALSTSSPVAVTRAQTSAGRRLFAIACETSQ